MNNENAGLVTFSVAFAERRDIGNEWNLVKWDRTLKEIQYHRLYLLTEGSATLRMSTGSMELLPGYVYFVPAFSVLESSIEGSMNKYYIHFSADDSIFDSYRYISNKFSVPAKAITESLFEMVVNNYTENTASARMKVQGALDLILADFLTELDADKSEAYRFRPVLGYIAENYKKKIKLDELAAIMNISSMYFSNLFKKTFNISPKQYILNKRLAEGQRLLLETRMSIKEVAYAVGFENENYFSEYFSAKIGTPPLKFRNREIETERKSIL